MDGNLPVPRVGSEADLFCPGLRLLANALPVAPPEFTLGSFCTVIDLNNFSRLQTLRLDGNELGQHDIPSDSPLCLRLASAIDV